MNIVTINYKNVVVSLVVSGLLFFGVAINAFAQTDEVLAVSVDGNVATVDFMRGTPCTPYVLSWGDGAEAVYVSEPDIMCIQVIDEVSLTHTYETAGTYTVALEMGGRSWSEELIIVKANGPTEPAEPFSLDDVADITYVWVDPNEMMADEEYYVYTITLLTGEVIMLETAAFTTIEYRNDQFKKVGYIGDVEELLVLAVQTVANIEGEITPEEELLSLYQQLKSLLEEMVSHLQGLLKK